MQPAKKEAPPCSAGEGPVQRLALQRVKPAQQVVQIRRTASGQHRCPLHNHDFPEIAWIESGPGLHLYPGGADTLQRGDLLFVRPEHVHTFRERRGDNLSLVNMAFAREVMEHLRARYLPASQSFFWDPADRPCRLQIDAALLAWLESAAGELVVHPNSQLRLDHFLLDLFCRLLPAVDSAPPTPTPPWLQQAIEAFCTPAHFATGVSGFVALTHRCREHVNRTVRRQFGQTTTALVNQARMRYAAQRLCFSDEAISAIGLACNCQSLGHFYRLFRAQFGTTPRLYRQRHRTTTDSQLA